MIAGEKRQMRQRNLVFRYAVLFLTLLPLPALSQYYDSYPRYDRSSRGYDPYPNYVQPQRYPRKQYYVQPPQTNFSLRRLFGVEDQPFVDQPAIPMRTRPSRPKPAAPVTVAPVRQ